MYQQKDLPFSVFPQLSKRDRAYQRGEASIRPFYQYDVDMESFATVEAYRRKYKVDRQTLVNALQNQYKTLPDSTATKQHIDALRKESTYTIITAHQPSLVTGPLYFIYKICSVISLSKKVNAAYDHFDVVPVFIMGGEDHDFEEIASAHFFGQTFTWETEQKGPTGRMHLDGLEKVLQVIYEKMGDQPEALDLRSKLENAYAASKSYGEFMQRFVHTLFGKYGLIIANMDQAIMKKTLLPYILRDIEHKDSATSVRRDQELIEQAGYKSQAHAREINAFWISDDRHRILAPSETEHGNYEINGEQYNKAALIQLLESDPSSISPNVILRPIYQELIMPNLAYVGGGGELAYWIERKTLFEKWDLPYPMLIRRDSMWILDKKTHIWTQDQQLSLQDLLTRTDDLVLTFAKDQSEVSLDFSEQKIQLEKIFNEISEVANSIDPTIKKTVGAESSKAIKSIDYLTSKLVKAEKQKNEVSVSKLKRIKEKHFPGNNGLQERHDNFIPYYLKYGQAWIDQIIKHADPMNKNFKILIEE